MAVCKHTHNYTHTFSIPVQPITLAKVTLPTVSSEEASRKTLHRRSGELELHRSTISKGASVVQLQAEVKSLSNTDRQALLEGLEFKIQLPPITGLALKADLSLPWNKMRTMKRYIRYYTSLYTPPNYMHYIL